jgi:competence protein ComFC
MQQFTTLLYRHLIEPVFDFIYPPVCLACASVMAGKRFVCGACESNIRILRYDSAIHSELRTHCLTLNPLLTDVYAGCLYEQGDVLQHLIHALKYSNLDSVGIYLGMELGHRLRHHYGVNQTWSLVPVPLHAVKKRERGYNQAEKIAIGIAKVTGAFVYPGVVKRLRNTISQTTLSFDQRRRNVAGAFIFKQPERHILPKIAVVDDVITTGSTITECASSIPPAAYTELYLFSVAYAV